MEYGNLQNRIAVYRIVLLLNFAISSEGFFNRPPLYDWFWNKNQPYLDHAIQNLWVNESKQIKVLRNLKAKQKTKKFKNTVGNIGKTIKK